MGISVSTATILHWLKSGKYINNGDSVLELGAQQLNNDLIESAYWLEKLASVFKVPAFSKAFDWTVKEKTFLASGMQHLPEDAPFANEFYEHLGLKYACVDFDDSPHSIKMDLNFDSVSENHRGKYGLVTNFGTTEHAANQLNAFQIVHDFTAPDGVMIHILPFQGFTSHGFVSYSMQFFWMLCRSNLYRVIDVNLSAWEKVKIQENVSSFVKSHSLIFENKDNIDDLEFQDMGIIIVLQKTHDIDFVPPIDVLNGTQTRDPIMKRRYWTVFNQGLLNQFLTRGKEWLKEKLDSRS